MKYKIGDKCKIIDSYYNKHLIGKIVTITNLKYYNPPFYDCSVDGINDYSILCAENNLEKL